MIYSSKENNINIILTNEQPVSSIAAFVIADSSFSHVPAATAVGGRGVSRMVILW